VSGLIEALAGKIDAQLAGRVRRSAARAQELAYETDAPQLLDVCRTLRDAPELKFEMLMDLAGIDYLHFGLDDWQTQSATRTGFSRARLMQGAVPPATELAFAQPGSGAGGPAVPPAPGTPPAAPVQPPAAAAAGGLEATITDAMHGVADAPGGVIAGGAAVPAPLAPGPIARDRHQGGPDSPPRGYRQPSGYRPPGRTDQLWGGPGDRQPSTYQGSPRRRPGRVLPFLLGVLFIVILAGAAALVLYLRGHGGPQTGPNSPGSRTTATSPANSPSSRAAVPRRPDAVVTAYYDAINARDYAAAYRLSTYAQRTKTFAHFKSGYAGTLHDTLTITGVTGDVVNFDLTANQTNGTVKTYTGTYTVRNGKIVAATVTRTS